MYYIHKKEVKIVDVWFKTFQKTEHTYITSIQIKKQNIARRGYMF